MVKENSGNFKRFLKNLSPKFMPSNQTTVFRQIIARALISFKLDLTRRYFETGVILSTKMNENP